MHRSHKVAVIREKALEHICRCYERPSDPWNRAEYHGQWHTIGVDRRDVKLMEVVLAVDPLALSEDEIQAGQCANWFHDYDQTWFRWWNAEGLLMRKRLPNGGVEGASSAALLRAMKDVGQFTSRQEELAHEAIMVTVPAYDPIRCRIIQPNLKPGVHLISVLLAIADLGGPAAMDGASFAKEGRLVFTEDHLYVLEALMECDMAKPPRNASFLAEKIVNFMASQAPFVDKFYERLHEDILPLVPQHLRGAILSVCNKGEEAKQEVSRLHKLTVQMMEEKDYMNLFRFMGYKV